MPSRIVFWFLGWCESVFFAKPDALAEPVAWRSIDSVLDPALLQSSLPGNAIRAAFLVLVNVDVYKKVVVVVNELSSVDKKSFLHKINRLRTF
jgi:hypothetical protein